MKVFTLQLSDLQLDRDEIYLNLGYGGQKPTPEFVDMIEELITQLGRLCVVRACYVVFAGTIRDDKYLYVNDQRIKIGSVIAQYLNSASHFAAFVVSAGAEFDAYLDKLKAEGDIVSEFLVYSIGSEIAESAVRYISTEIATEARLIGLKTTHSYSPGHCSWHVREQENLFALFPEKPCGVLLNASSLMFPIKSVSGIIGMGADIRPTPYSCDSCGMQTCFKRKKRVEK